MTEDKIMEVDVLDTHQREWLTFFRLAKFIPSIADFEYVDRPDFVGFINECKIGLELTFLKYSTKRQIKANHLVKQQEVYVGDHNLFVSGNELRSIVEVTIKKKDEKFTDYVSNYNLHECWLHIRYGDFETGYPDDISPSSFARVILWNGTHELRCYDSNGREVDRVVREECVLTEAEKRLVFGRGEE
jgi:hypothetical protein